VFLGRFKLSAGERLKSRTDFEKVYSSGRVVFSDNKNIKAVYLIEKVSEPGKIKIATAVSGKAGKAVWRNRLKRLLRTSYRLNKENLLNICLQKKIVLKIIFSPYRFQESKNRVVMLKDIMPGMKDVLLKIERKV
jgi:ribonuclease P protein component